VFGPTTEAALREFQSKRGLRTDGVCGQQTWAAIVEAGWHPGDRLLYYATPMLRGDDVAALQRRLGQLGFDAAGSMGSSASGPKGRCSTSNATLG
jgi:N-acetylmuramoyl-L-alanine amidase